MQLDRESLDRIDFDLKKWCCQCKKCDNHTKIRDYGIAPYYFHTRKGWGWNNLYYQYYLCSKHTKFFRHLKKRFDIQVIEDKMLDWLKNKIF